MQAFVVAKDGTVTSERLDEFLLTSDLSSYQRPRAYHFVADLRRTTTYKINGRAPRESKAKEAS